MVISKAYNSIFYMHTRIIFIIFAKKERSNVCLPDEEWDSVTISCAMEESKKGDNDGPRTCEMHVFRKLE